MTASTSVDSYAAEEAAYRQRNRVRRRGLPAAQQVLAGGNSRLTAFFKPFPFYVERGEGCVLRTWTATSASTSTTTPPR